MEGNISYKFNDAVLAYETISTGFRGGGLNAVNNPFEPIPAAFGPDTLTNFEVGFKGRLLQGLLDYQADAYFIRWDNIQVQETTPDGAFHSRAMQVRRTSRVSNLSWTARPIQYLTVNFSGSYQDATLAQGAKEQQYMNNPTLGRTGDSIPNVPKFQADFA